MHSVMYLLPLDYQHGFTPLKTPLCFAYPALLSPQTHGNHWFNASAFFICHIDRMISYVWYPFDYILSLSNVHLRLMYVFHGLVAHFFFSLIPYCVDVLWVVHSPLKGILHASSFLVILNKATISTWRFLWDYSFSNILEAWVLDIW